MAAVEDREDDELGDFVRVKRLQTGFELADAGTRGLDHYLALVGRFDRALPRIDRSHRRQHVHTCRESFRDQRLRELIGVAIGRPRRQDDDEVRFHLIKQR